MACAAFIAGCSDLRNPSFPLTTREAEAALARMALEPQPLERPLVIIGGFADPGLGTTNLRQGLEPCFRDPVLLTVNLDGVGSFEEARERVLAAVLESFPDPGGSPLRSAEIDIVGNSLGGLVAVDAWRSEPGGGALAVKRLFTIGTPFQGAAVAEVLPIDELARRLRPGSSIVVELDEAACAGPLELIPYVRHDDAFVGAANASPSCRLAWWVPGELFESGHMTSFRDRRIHADIARRLRGEAPFTIEPPAPLPADARLRE
jgi:hypothetical protein